MWDGGGNLCPVSLFVPTVKSRVYFPSYSVTLKQVYVQQFTEPMNVISTKKKLGPRVSQIKLQITSKEHTESSGMWIPVTGWPWVLSDRSPDVDSPCL